MSIYLYFFAEVTVVCMRIRSLSLVLLFLVVLLMFVVFSGIPKLICKHRTVLIELVKRKKFKFSGSAQRFGFVFF